MAEREILIGKFFRQKPGDVGIKDMPFFGGDLLEQSKHDIGKALLSYFNDEHRQLHQRPHTAQLIGADDRIIAQFDVRPVIGVGNQSVARPTHA